MRKFIAFLAGCLMAGIALAGTATLSWTNPTTNTDGSTLTSLASVNVYRSSSATSAFIKLATASPAVGSTAVPTIFTDANAAAGATLYYYVTAVNSAGTESSPSTTVSVTIPETPSAPTNLQIRGG